jgi:hypothetical protein
MREHTEQADPALESRPPQDDGGAPALSLTDLLDEMDRAAFRRSLAERDALVSAYRGEPGSD